MHWSALLAPQLYRRVVAVVVLFLLEPGARTAFSSVTEKTGMGLDQNSAHVVRIALRKKVISSHLIDAGGFAVAYDNVYSLVLCREDFSIVVLGY